MTEEGGLFVCIGTYTATESEGIYVCHLDPSSGVLEFASKAISMDNPAYLAIDPQCCCLYMVHEVGKFGGKPGGAVSAFPLARKHSTRSRES